MCACVCLSNDYYIWMMCAGCIWCSLVESFIKSYFALLIASLFVFCSIDAQCKVKDVSIEWSVDLWIWKIKIIRHWSACCNSMATFNYNKTTENAIFPHDQSLNRVSYNYFLLCLFVHGSTRIIGYVLLYEIAYKIYPSDRLENNLCLSHLRYLRFGYTLWPIANVIQLSMPFSTLHVADRHFFFRPTTLHTCSSKNNETTNFTDMRLKIHWRNMDLNNNNNNNHNNQLARRQTVNKSRSMIVTFMHLRTNYLQTECFHFSLHIAYIADFFFCAYVQYISD